MKVFVCRKQIERSLALVVFFFALVSLSTSCKPTTASGTKKSSYYKYNLEKAEFDLGDRAKFEFSDLSFSTDGEDRLLAHYKKILRSNEESLGNFVSLSEDGGEKFRKEYKISELFKSAKGFAPISFEFTKSGIAAIIAKKGNVFYSHSDKGLDDWSTPIQINDVQGAFIDSGRFLQSSANDVYCIWADKRRGDALLYFSSSHDGGRHGLQTSRLRMIFVKSDKGVQLSY